jgi:enoyl-CoA hydratase/carnithine racemase
MGVIVVEQKDDVEVVTLNNPARLNSLNLAALAEFNAYFVSLRQRLVGWLVGWLHSW